MTPEERELLVHSIKLAEENNKILRGIRRNARISSFLRVFYWLIILGSAFGLYYYTKPYIDGIVDSYIGMQQSLEKVTDLKTKLPSLPTWLGGN